MDDDLLGMGEEIPVYSMFKNGIPLYRYTDLPLKYRMELINIFGSRIINNKLNKLLINQICKFQKRG